MMNWFRPNVFAPAPAVAHWVAIVSTWAALVATATGIATWLVFELLAAMFVVSYRRALHVRRRARRLRRLEYPLYRQLPVGLARPRAAGRIANEADDGGPEPIGTTPH
jgi:hypothetical protein